MSGNNERESKRPTGTNSPAEEAGAEGVTEFTKGVTRPQAIGASKEDWIGSQLKRVYGNVVDEGIPDDMMALLGQLDGDETDGSAGDKS